MASSSSSNDTAADYMQRLYAFDQVKDITANVFTDNRDVIENIINANNVDGELWSKNDFVTMENELADDEDRRVSSMHTTTLAVKNSTMTSPFFDSVTGELKNAMVVQGNVPVDVYLDMTPADLDEEIQAALSKQLSFGLDSAAGVMKNCIASHNVIHSMISSVLMYNRAKIVENRSLLADNEEGKVMAIYRIADTMAKISSLVQEAKKVSDNLADGGEAKNSGGGGVSSAVVGEKYIDLTRAKLPAKCNFCNVVGHGPTPIIGQFSDRLQKEYIKRNGDIIKEKRRVVQKGGLTDIFITRSSGASQTHNNIASKAASAAIQHNYAVNTGERSSIECAFKRAKFDSQVDHLMQSYTDSRIRQLEYQQQQQQQQETPGQTCVVTEEREREDECSYEAVRDIEKEENEKEEECEESSTDETTEPSAVAPSSETKPKEKEKFLSLELDNANQVVEVADNGEKTNPPVINGGYWPNFKIVQPFDANAPLPVVQNLTMQRLQYQLSPPQLKTAAETSPALSPGYADPAEPLPLVFPESQRQTEVAEFDLGLLPVHTEHALLSPVPSSPTRQTTVAEFDSGLPPGYAEKIHALLSPIRSPPTTALVGSILEPSQSETERAAPEIRGLEMMGYSPSLPAIRGRDRQNRASMRMAVKKFAPQRRYK